MKNLVLFGPPGAGKGTQAALLAKHYGLVHISTGDIFREEIKNQTPLGVKIKSIIDDGELVPDAILIEMIKNVFIKNRSARGILLDGFPRTIAQAEGLDALLLSEHTEISAVLSLHVETEELLSRLLIRSQLSNRTDDNEDIITHRLDVYKVQTFPLESYYMKQDKFITIEGVGSVEEIFAALCKVIDNLGSK